VFCSFSGFGCFLRLFDLSPHSTPIIAAIATTRIGETLATTTITVGTAGTVWTKIKISSNKIPLISQNAHLVHQNWHRISFTF
jgi:hypothetical protein